MRKILFCFILLADLYSPSSYATPFLNRIATLKQLIPAKTLNHQKIDVLFNNRIHFQNLITHKPNPLTIFKFAGTGVEAKTRYRLTQVLDSSGVMNGNLNWQTRIKRALSGEAPLTSQNPCGGCEGICTGPCAQNSIPVDPKQCGSCEGICTGPCSQKPTLRAQIAEIRNHVPATAECQSLIEELELTVKEYRIQMRGRGSFDPEVIKTAQLGIDVEFFDRLKESIKSESTLDCETKQDLLKIVSQFTVETIAESVEDFQFEIRDGE